MPLATIRGVRIAYEDEGHGPPVILVHGSWTSRRSWDLVAPKLADRFRVIRHDRRGHSDSGSATGTLEDDADDIVALAEQAEALPFHLACSSRGGVIGLKLAARRPDVLRRVVCHEPPLLDAVPRDAPERVDVERVLADEARVVELIDRGQHELAARTFVDEIAFGPGAWERLPRFLRQVFVANAPTYSDEHRDADAYGVDLAALRRFDHPVLLTTSDDSPAWFGAVLGHLTAVLPNVERHTYAGGGHNPHGSVATEYVRVVGGFLSR